MSLIDAVPSITNPIESDTLAGNPHTEQHAHANDWIEAIVEKIGTESSTPAVGTHLVATGAGTSEWVAGWFNVKAYHALGNNSTDDTAAIQACIDACEAAGGGTVYFPEGVYIVTGLTVDSNKVHIVGDGRDTVIIKAKSTMTGHLLTIAADYCSVRSLTLYGALVGQDCLRLFGAARFHADDLYVYNAGVNGISIEGDGSNSAHGNQFSNIAVIGCVNGYGLHHQSGTYDTEWVNLWIGTCLAGVRADSGALTFSTLHVWGCTGIGVDIRSAANRLANVYIETNGGHGIAIAGAGYTTIVGGVVRTNGSYGIGVATSAPHVRIIGLAVYDNTVGVRLGSGADKAIVSACSFFDTQTPKTQTYGIEVVSGSSGIVIEGCVAADSDHLTAGWSIATGTCDVVSIGANRRMRGDLTLTDAAGTNRDVVLATDGTPRWIIRATSSTESGTNAGSDLSILARADDGSALSAPIAITRASAQVALAGLLQVVAASGIRWGASGGPLDLADSGSPEGAVSAPVGSTYRRTDGGAGSSFYVKESGTGNTGWVAK